MTTETVTTPDRRDFGHVYRRGPTYWIRYSVGGKRYRESTGSTSAREAEKRLRRRQAELGLGRFVAPDVQRTTFDELAALLLDDYRMNGRRSLRRVQSALAHLRAAFGGARALSVPARVSTYIRDRQDAGAAPATTEKELAALKRMFTLGYRAGKVAQPPHIPTLMVDNVRQGFFERPDFEALLAELPEDLRPMMEFAYYTGWRIPSEVLPLTWRQVDFRAGVMRLEPGTTKNGEGRTFPFAALPALATLLRAQLERTTALERELGVIVPSVFWRGRGTPIRDFRTVWQTACRRAGLVGRIPHDLRRTAVRNLERAGVPRSVAMKLTGHKTEAVYRRYAIVAEQDLREGVAKLAALAPSGERTILPLHHAEAAR